MHILILTNSVRPYSGWGRCASDLIAGIRNAGHSVTILKEEDDGYEGISILKRGAGIFGLLAVLGGMQRSAMLSMRWTDIPTAS